MGYFIHGTTNQAFMIKKDNLKPAYEAVCKLNINNALKDGSYSHCEPANFGSGDVSDTYATNQHYGFEWVDWNFDAVTHTLEEALHEFGFQNFKHDPQGDLTSMDFDMKLGDQGYVLDTIAPFVEKGGKMKTVGEDGTHFVTDFDKIQTYSNHELEQKRRRLLILVKFYRDHITYNDLKHHTVRISTALRHVADDLLKYAIQCGGRLADQNDKEDLATAPYRTFMNVLTNHGHRQGARSDVLGEIHALVPFSTKGRTTDRLHVSNFGLNVAYRPHPLTWREARYRTASFSPLSYQPSSSVDYVHHYLNTTVKALEEQDFSQVKPLQTAKVNA